MDVWMLFWFPVQSRYKLVDSEVRPDMVMLGSCFLRPLHARCIIDTVAFQSKNGHLEVGNVDITAYGIPECYAAMAWYSSIFYVTAFKFQSDLLNRRRLEKLGSRGLQHNMARAGERRLCVRAAIADL
jgi:hypothetical protein